MVEPSGKENRLCLKIFSKLQMKSIENNLNVLAKIQICDLNEMFALKVIFALNLIF